MLNSKLSNLACFICFSLAVLLVYLSWSYFTADPSDYPFVQQRETYAKVRTPLLTHIAFASVALILGPIQFVRSFRRKHKAVHRLLGSVYVLSISISAVASFMIAPNAYTGASASAGFMTLGILWIVSTWTALVYAIRGNFKEHARWMLRSYALTFAAITLRLELGALIFGAGLSQAEAYSIVAWLSWTLNLIFVEWKMLNQTRNKRRLRTASP